MTPFLAACAVLIAIALAFLLFPLLKRRNTIEAATPSGARNAAVYQDQLAELDAELARGTIDQAQWRTSRNAIERRALDEAETDDTAAPPTAPRTQRAGIAALVIGISTPVVALLIYALLGAPQAMFPESASAPQQSMSAEQIDAMVAQLAERMKSNPADTGGWVMLGRSYVAMGRYDDSAKAYAKAAEQRPADAQILADYADALGMANGRNLKGAPEALIARALKADDKNIKALTLAGTVAYQNGDFARAVKLWETILPQVPNGEPFAEQVRAIIADASEKMGAKPAAKSAAKSAAKTSETNAPRDAAAGAALLQGTVTLSPALKAKTSPDDTVFIYARAASGPRMPLAIVKSTVSALPLQFSLDDASAMNPQMKLSAFDQVVVVARVSKSGTPAPQKGDLEGITAAMAPRAKGIKLEIGRSID